jgi:hypothetical protein
VHSFVMRRVLDIAPTIRHDRFDEGTPRNTGGIHSAVYLSSLGMVSQTGQAGTDDASTRVKPIAIRRFRVASLRSEELSKLEGDVGSGNAKGDGREQRVKK